MIEDIEWGIIFANDLVDPQKSIEMSELVAPYVDAIKIGITTSMKHGVGIFRQIKERTGKIELADFKVADIGFWNDKKKEWEGTNNKIVGELVSAGADYVICHTIVGSSSIQESVDTAHKQGGKVLTLPYMSHVGADVFFDLPFPVEHAKKTLEPVGMGAVAEAIAKLQEEKNKNPEHWRLPYASVSDAILLIGEHVKVDGYIGPANKLPVLKDYRKLSPFKNVFSPGVGRQDKTRTEEKQLEELYDVLGIRSAAIIGSTIYKAEDPAAAARSYMEMRNKITKELKYKSAE